MSSIGDDTRSVGAEQAVQLPTNTHVDESIPFFQSTLNCDSLGPLTTTNALEAMTLSGSTSAL